MAQLSPILLFEGKDLTTGLNVRIEREDIPPEFLNGQENKNNGALFVCFEIRN